MPAPGNRVKFVFSEWAGVVTFALQRAKRSGISLRSAECKSHNQNSVEPCLLTGDLRLELREGRATAEGRLIQLNGRSVVGSGDGRITSIVPV
jgi:hypothetical protein